MHDSTCCRLHAERRCALQANAYVSARNALPLPTTPPAPPPTVSPSQRDAIRTTLLDLFDVGLSATTGFDLGARLTGVSNILQALTDLSALHNDSLASGLLQTLLDNLTA